MLEMKLNKTDLCVLIVIGLVPILCAIVYSLPPSIQLALAAQGDTLDPARFITSVFVHGNLAHIVGNAVGFLIFGLLLFGLNKVAGSQKFLLYSLAWVILLVPLLYGVFVWVFFYIIFHGIFSGYSFGLSLVVGGVMGLIVPSILSLLHTELQNNVNRGALFLGLLMLTGSIMIVMYLHSNLFYWMFFVVITVFGFSLLGIAFLRTRNFIVLNFDRWIFVKLSFAVFGIVLYFSLMPGLFPAEIVMPNLGIVNIFAHYFGVSLGTLPGIYLVVHDKKQ